MRLVNYRPYCAALRAAGFVKTHDSRAGGIRTIVFERTIAGRRLDVQLWGDGKHRVSHWHVYMHTDNGPLWRMDTTPTDFTTVEEMPWAIINELSREDHPHV